MAENLLSKINLDRTEMTIADAKARTDASNAVSTANAAKATANAAKATAMKKALITYDSTTHTMIITQGGE